MSKEVAALPLERLARFSFSTILAHAIRMECIMLVEEAHVSVEHHLTIYLFLVGLVDQLPLVLVRIATNGTFGSPTMSHYVSEVVIVEDRLVFRISPSAIVAGVVWFGTTDCVGSRQSSELIPSLLLSPWTIIDVV